MDIIDKNIDGGKAFDWGRVSESYARYRDIYPMEFYQKIVNRGLCVKGQRVLDIGTGTGVLPRNMYKFGAEWVGTDISDNQIAQAERLSAGMNIKYLVSLAEKLDFPNDSFDVITACQCFWYFRHEELMPLFRRILKPCGKLLVLYMAWLPFEDKIAGESEKLILKYSPKWSGAGETMHPIFIPECYDSSFERTWHEEFRLNIPFTRESWNGRMKACRGVRASLTPEEIQRWEQEHHEMLSHCPEEFEVIHYAAMAELTLK